MPPPDPLPGYATDSLRFDALLGRGGMGAVYRGMQVRLARPVAIKVIKPDLAGDPGYRERFIREAQTMGRLVHPHAVACHDFGPIRGPSGDELLVMVMELVEGRNLGALAAERRLPVREVLRWYAQACDALAAAHRLGVVHRDLKPDNIMITAAGSAKLADFGLARAADSIQVTRTGAIVGSPAYMSPEAAMGHDPAPASDVYGLGCSLFHTLAGRPPFHAASTLQVLQQHAASPPPRFSAARPDLAILDRLLARCLAKAPAERPDPVALGRDLLALAARVPAAAATAAPCSPTPLPAVQPVRRAPAPPTAVPRRIFVLAGIVVALLLVLVVIGALRRARAPELPAAAPPAPVAASEPPALARAGAVDLIGAELAPGHPDAPVGAPAAPGTAARVVKSRLGVLRLRLPASERVHLTLLLHPAPGSAPLRLRLAGRDLELADEDWQLVHVEVPAGGDLDLTAEAGRAFSCAAARWSTGAAPAWSDLGVRASMLVAPPTADLRDHLARLPGRPADPAFDRTAFAARPGAAALLGGDPAAILARSFTGGGAAAYSAGDDQRAAIEQAMRGGARWCLVQLDSAAVPVGALRADWFCTGVEQALAGGGVVIPVLAGLPAPRNAVLWTAWRQQARTRLPGMPILDREAVERFHRRHGLPDPDPAAIADGFANALVELRLRIAAAMLPR